MDERGRVVIKKGEGMLRPVGRKQIYVVSQAKGREIFKGEKEK